MPDVLDPERPVDPPRRKCGTAGAGSRSTRSRPGRQAGCAAHRGRGRVGPAAAAASSRVLESFLFGVAPGDRFTFIVAPLVLIAVALVACWLPARRATRIDPLETLRLE